MAQVVPPAPGGSIWPYNVPLPPKPDEETAMSIEAKLKELGLELPPAPKDVVVYKPVVVVGNLAYV